MSFSADPMVSAKADFRIFIDDTDHLAIEDRHHKLGGNVSSKGGRKLSWWNDTGGACTLTFFEQLDESTTGDDPPAWPFDESPNVGTNGRLLPAASTSDENPWKGKLTSPPGAQTLSYEYKVHVVMPSGKTYDLDPTIIVRP